MRRLLLVKGASGPERTAIKKMGMPARSSTNDVKSSQRIATVAELNFYHALPAPQNADEKSGTCSSKMTRKVSGQTVTLVVVAEYALEQLKFPENTTYQPLPGRRCCDN